MQFFISFIPLDFPDSTKRPVESGFWVFFVLLVVGWLVVGDGGGSGVALVLFWVCLFGFFFFRLSSRLLSNFVQGFGFVCFPAFKWHYDFNQNGLVSGESQNRLGLGGRSVGQFIAVQKKVL